MEVDYRFSRMGAPVNLYYTADGRTVLRYWTRSGRIRERIVRHPAALLMQPPDVEADVSPGVLETPEAVMFAAFRALPLCPHGAWCLASGRFSTVYERVFALLLRMLREQSERRWCVRGEPGWFLQFGVGEQDPVQYSLGAFVLPCGRPAVLTFRTADMVERVPMERPFAEMTVISEADGLPARIDDRMPWDTRVRLPIAERGAAKITLNPILT